MFVEDFGSALDSKALNVQLKQVYNWSLNLNEMSNDEANSVLSAFKTKIGNIKSSSKVHFAEKNPQYMEALLVTKVLESFIEENYRQQAMERKLKKAEITKRDKYAKGMEKVAGDFEKRYPGRGEEVRWATATNMAKTESVAEAMDVLRNALAGSEPINEGEYEGASAIMAARDMVDTIQDMVEKLSSMMNEDLPALADVMRSQVGQQQSEAFVSAVNSSVGPLLDQVKAARTSMDNAARAAAGEATMEPSASVPAEVPMEPSVDDIPMPPEDEEVDATADTATGGDLELGRTKRV